MVNKGQKYPDQLVLLHTGVYILEKSPRDISRFHFWENMKRGKGNKRNIRLKKEKRQKTKGMKLKG
jgi:hypothetical protein